MSDPSQSAPLEHRTVVLLQQLLNDSIYAELAALEESFNLFNVIDECIDENAYSRFLAFLFDSRKSHRLGILVCRDFLHNALGSIAKKFVDSSDVGATRATVEWGTDEQRRIDIVVQLLGKKGELLAVFGIENKTWSDELYHQLRDYQVALTKAYPSVPRVLFFLTPDGRPSTTADIDHSCGVISISYSKVMSVCSTIADHSSPEVAPMLRSFAEHIQARFTGISLMDDKAKQLILKLYGDPKHRTALRLISQHLPSVSQFIEYEVTKSVALKIGLDVEFAWYHPKKPGTAYEFNFNIGKLNPLGVDFENENFYVLYMLLFDEYRPADIGVGATVQVMLRVEDKKARKKEEFLQANLSLPSSRPGEKWGPWRCLWTGDSYTLCDLGDHDLKGLATILGDAVEKTYKPLLQTMKAIREKF